MYISCSVLWDAGITKGIVNCCGSCHDDAEIFPGQYDLIELYPEDAGLTLGDETIGEVCCTVANFLNAMVNKEEILLEIYQK